MSCAWSFECLSHTPSVVGDEFTNHTDDHLYKKALELARQRPLDESVSDVMYNDDYYHYEKAARYFLIQHPTCELGIVDEYGKHLTLDEADPPKPDIPDWYRVTSRGITILQCVTCIRTGCDPVMSAAGIQDGDSVCIYHLITTKENDN